MRTAFLALALATTSALTASALDGTEFVERHGPQFLFAWPDAQRDVLVEAVEGLSRSPYITNDVTADRETHERRQRAIVARARAGMPFYDHRWRLVQPFSLISTDGSSWGIYQMSLPETEMIGLASGWYFCDPSDQDTDDAKAAASHCADMTERAKMLTEQIASSRHVLPGGFSGDVRN